MKVCQSKPVIGALLGALLVVTLCAVGLASASDRTDQSFGTEGTVLIEAPSAAPAGASISGLSAAPDGDLLAALAGGRSPGFFGIARFTASGQLDAAFGEDGFGTVSRISHPGPSGERLATYAEGIAVTADGGAVVAGFQANGVRGTAPLLAHFRADGSLDQSFGHGGIVAPKPATEATSQVHPFEGGGELHGVGVEANGRIIAVGSQNENAGGQPAAMVIAYHSDGTIDHSFGSNGRVLFKAPNRALETAFTTVRVLDDNSILVGGYLRGHLTVVSLTPAGKLDRRFGDSGRASIPLPRYSFCCQGRALLAVRPNGKILVGGEAPRSAESPLALLQLKSDGTVDRSFGAGGQAAGSPAGKRGLALEPEAVSVQRNGRIVVTGYLERVAAGGKVTPVLTSLRYLPSGKLDRGFGDGGAQTLASIGSGVAEAALTESAGRVVVAGGVGGNGSSGPRLLMTRYLPG